jgi:iron(III) transport system substrate-binding protein
MATRLSRRTALGLGLSAGLSAGALAGCSQDGSSGGSSGGGSSNDSSDTLTVYTDQHAELIKALTSAYTHKTGVGFKIQNDATVGQIKAEGKASPADVFLSEDPGPVAQLAAADKLVRIKDSTMKHVRPHLSSEHDKWVAYAARCRVLYYNPKLIKKSQLPKSLADITQHKYQNKFCWAPSGAFVATTQYLISDLGTAKTKSFLSKIKKNGTNEHKNGNVRDTVEAGKHAMGLCNHYYWWIKAAEVGGPDKMTSKIYHFPTEDPGNLILSSGAGILHTSKNHDAAAKFVSWLTDKDGGQKILESGDIDKSGAQYPVAAGTSSKTVGSLSAVKSPSFDMDVLAKQDHAEDMLKSLGMSS